jgi:hypothetical protein
MFRSAFASALAFGLAACGAEIEWPQPAGIAAEPMAPFPEEIEDGALGELVWRGGAFLTFDHAQAGPVTGFAVSDDGARLLAVTASGLWLSAALSYDEDGEMTGASDGWLTPMAGEDGLPLPGQMPQALALLPDGRAVASFAAAPVLRVYTLSPDWSGLAEVRPEPLPAPPGAERWTGTTTLRALAPTGDALWAGLERALVDGQSHPVFRYDLDDLHREPGGHTVRLQAGYGLAAFAAWGGDDLIAVERFTARGGDRIRLTVVPASAIRPEPGRLPGRPRLLAEAAQPAGLGTIRGAAVADVDGRQRLFVLASGQAASGPRAALMSFDLPAREE